MKLTGTVSCTQHTVQVSGGTGYQGGVTRHITLFRIGGHQCKFASPKPTAISDGDYLTVSGRSTASGVAIYAVRNATNNIISHSGIAGPILSGLSVVLFAPIFCGILLLFSPQLAGVIFLACVAFSVYFFWSAVRAATARRDVAT